MSTASDAPIDTITNVTNTRNFAIIAQIDAGKSTISDNILAIGGLIKESDIGKKRGTDTLDVEKERGITVKSTGVSVDFNLSGQNYKINMIDSPGHIDFNQNTQSAIRITDGAFVLLDAVAGVEVQTVTVLRQALADRVKPVLIINKFDRLLFELQLPPEEVYLRLVKMISDVNQLIEDYQTEDNRWIQGDLSPVDGTVIFTSAYHNWGFDIPTLASMYNPDPEKAKEMAKCMFGDYFFDSSTNQIIKTGTESNRIFCLYVYTAIKEMTEYLTNPNVPRNYRRHFKKLGYNIEAEENEPKSRELYRQVFRKLFHLGSTLKNLIAYKLPNPMEAQQYRASVLYSGPLDETAPDGVYRSIKACDPNGPLMFYVTLMVPTGEGGRFYAFGRIFSGTLRPGQKVTVLDTNYEYGSKKDIFTNKSVQRVVQFIGAKIEQKDEVVAGNIVAIQGIDNVMTKSGTVTSLNICHPIRTIKFTVSPVVQVSVRPKEVASMQKFIDGMKRLAKSDPVVKIEVNESGENLICATGDLHMELCILDLKMYSGVDIIVGEPVVPLRETITESTNTVCLKKSANKHNRLYMTAEPLPEELITDLESGEYSTKDMVKLTRLLVDKYGWTKSEVLKIWGLAPYNKPSNILVDCTVGLQYLNEIKDGIYAGFSIAVDDGVVCNEQIRGVRFNITDIVLHADAIHRGQGQSIPMARECTFACMLANTPTIYEPMFEATISTTREKIGEVYSCLAFKRGRVIDEESSEGTPTVTVKGVLPVVEAFGFDAYIKDQTSGKAFPSLMFSHWEKTDGNIRDNLILKTRLRKDPTKPNVPDISQYLDKI